MKSLVATTLFALLICVGCQHSSASKLSGRWDLLPPEEINNNNSDKNDDSKEVAAGNAEDLFDSVAGGDAIGTMSVIFHSNGKLETFTDFPMAATGSPKIGKWKFKAWDESKNEIIVECDLLDEKTTTPIRFIDDNTIELVPPNLAVLKTKLRFKRSQ